MCIDTPVPGCAFGEQPKEAANGLLLWYSSNKFGVNFIPRDIWYVNHVNGFALWHNMCSDGSMNPEASPYPAQTNGDDRNPRKQKTTASPIDSGMISKKAKSWVQTGYVPRVATSSVFSKHRETRLTEILPALFQWSLPLLILDKALFQALVE